MDLLYLVILAALALFLAFTGYRYYVFKVGFANYFSFCINYCALRNKHESFLKDVVKVWPMRYWIFDFSNWTLDKYIINQDMYQEMLEDMENEALKLIEKMKAIMDTKPDVDIVTTEDIIAAAEEPIKQDLLAPPITKPPHEENHQG